MKSSITISRPWMTICGRFTSPCLVTQQNVLRRWKCTNEDDNNDGYLKQVPGYSTTAIHFSQEPEKWKCGSLIPPITMSSTYMFKTTTEFYSKFFYGRLGNPTRNMIEECLAALECGVHGFTFASGLGSISAVFSLLSSGDHVISINDIYGGTYLLIKDIISRFGIEITFVDVTKPEKIGQAIKKNTKMVYLETPTNPNCTVLDIAATCKMVKKHGDIMVVVDNTFLTSYFQRPLDFGADIVVYSLSKYMNGHSDVIMGGAVVNDDNIAKRLRYIQSIMGGVPSPFDCYLVNRGLKTLALRMERHKKSGLAIAKWLELHPNIREVLHPGLKTHKQHAITKKQTSGHSGIFSFRHCGDLETSKTLLTSLKVFTLAVSLGGFESLAQLPSQMTHGHTPENIRNQLGITHDLIRVSVGLEDCNDLIEDLDQALKLAFCNNKK